MGSSLSALWQDSPQPLATQSDASTSNKGAAANTLVTVLQNAHDAQIYGGTFNAAGRDIVTVVNNYYGPTPAHSSYVSKIQDWLAPSINYRTIQIDTFSKRTPGTGSWFIKSKEFREWLGNKGMILWGTGMPGAGKTILTSVVIAHLQSLMEHYGNGEIFVAFAYCRYTDPIPVKDILAGLVIQLLEGNSSLETLVEPLYSKHQRNRTQPTQGELIDLLMRIADASKMIFFILDGLDEAPKDVQFDLIKILSSLRANFLITSRPLKSLESNLPNAEFFIVVAQEEDIKTHVMQKIDWNPELHHLAENNNLKDEIVASICESSQGMFLHASLQLEALQDCVTVDEVREVLNTFPAKIGDLYAITMLRIEKQAPNRASLAKRILLLIIYARTSLSIRQLQYALALSVDTNTFEPGRVVDEMFIVSVCCGLITIDKESKLVRLVHFTAKDVLQPILLREFPDPHKVLASICISCLIACGLLESSLQDMYEFRAACRNEPFLHYAYLNWHEHAKQCDSPSVMHHIADQFLRKCCSFPVVIPGVRDLTVDYANPVQTAAYYDMLKFLSGTFDCDARTPRTASTPLILALSYDHDYVGYELHKTSESALILLENPEINVNATSNLGRSVLGEASRVGHEDVVRRLLEFPGIRVNTGTTDFILRTALSQASYHGHAGIVDLLLGHPKINVNAASRSGMSALIALAATGSPREAMVKRLLQHPGIRVNWADDRGWTALMHAAYWGSLAVTQVLLGFTGIQVDKKDVDGCSALAIAVDTDRLEIAECLRLAMHNPPPLEKIRGKFRKAYDKRPMR